MIPKEGGNIWEDTWAIPVGAPHPENAHAFLNFVLDGDNGKKIADTVQYATPNAAAKAKMDAAYTSNPAIYPPADRLALCEATIYAGEEAVKARDEVWTAIQAA